jgi:BirA family biotin operon repressor/biotin-[acetyl-CoA-carboxylase] ligase
MKIHLKQTDSTNRIAKEKAYQGLSSGSVVWAASQNGGKGQYERSFSSPVGGLYFSLLLNPVLPPADVPLITLATGLACRDVLSEHCQVEALIKWPNDLYLAGKKVGGILCENMFDTTRRPPVSTVIVGVGLNINSSLSDFPVELHPILTTIYEQTRILHDLESLLDLCVTHIQHVVESLSREREAVLHRWQGYDYLFGRPLHYVGGSETVFGTGKGIASDGRYQLIDQDGKERLVLGGQLRPDDGSVRHC